MGVGHFRQKAVTLHHLDPGTLFRDRNALWRVDDGGNSDNILATRVASWSVNNTGELIWISNKGSENYNAYNEVILKGDGIYEVIR